MIPKEASCLLCRNNDCIKCGGNYHTCVDFKSRNALGCEYASRTDEGHGWKCFATDGECMFLNPNVIACYETYGEGPLSSINCCEQCKKFYTHNGRRCCERHPLTFDKDYNFFNSEFIDDVVCCGGIEKIERCSCGELINEFGFCPACFDEGIQNVLNNDNQRRE